MVRHSIPDLKSLAEEILLYAQRQSEYGAKRVVPFLARLEKDLRRANRKIQRLPIDTSLARREPSGLAAIRRLRPHGPRRLWNKLPDNYSDKLAGALLGRMAGCTLGSPVEFWPIAKMKALAEENGDKFPPVDYWSYVPEPAGTRYLVSRRSEYTRTGMRSVPADDDIAYTLVGLLVVEKYGFDFTVEQVGQLWQRLLPMAYSAEKTALQNLRNGCPAMRAGASNNPYCEWIGAWIRADPWAYVAPGWPEKAAELAWRDAFLTHRRQGIYGAMFFAAAISAAFATGDPIEALRIGLTEIPARCRFAQAMRWALRRAHGIRNYQQARTLVDKRFKDMHGVHAVNNACLVALGLAIGGSNFTKVIGQTVAMGLDNDCTAATAGSLFGASFGKKLIPRKWTCRFNNRIHTYLTGRHFFAIDDVVSRFARQAGRIHARD